MVPRNLPCIDFVWTKALDGGRVFFKKAANGFKNHFFTSKNKINRRIMLNSSSFNMQWSDNGWNRENWTMITGLESNN